MIHENTLSQEGRKNESGCKPRTIVEIGPGPMPFPAFVGSRKLESGEHYIGVDISMEDIKHAATLGRLGFMNKEDEKNENTDISFIVADAAGQLALEKGSADEVIAKNVLADPNIPRERAGAILKEISRIAKTGGRIIFVETNTPNLELFHNAMKKQGLGLSDLGFKLERFTKYRDDTDAFSQYGSEIPDRESFIAEFIKTDTSSSHE